MLGVLQPESGFTSFPYTMNDFPPVQLYAFLASTIAVMCVTLNAPVDPAHGMLRKFLPVYPFAASAGHLEWILFIKMFDPCTESFWQLVVHSSILIGLVVVGIIIFTQRRNQEAIQRNTGLNS